MDYKSNIEQMRKNFASSRRTRSDRLKGRPPWTFNHVIGAQYDKQDEILFDGKIFYASLNQANTAIFRKGFGNFGAVLVYSPDPFYDEHPEKLTPIARMLYSYKDSAQNAPSELKYFADAITDESVYFLNLLIPPQFTYGRVVYATTVVLHRHHLPGRRLSGGLFPILANPDAFKPCMVLPKAYWTKEFTEAFLSERI